MVSQETSKIHVEPNSFDPASFVQQETSKTKVFQHFFVTARLLKRAGSNEIEPLFSCLSLVEGRLQRLVPTCLRQVGIGGNAKFAWGSPLPD